ncbi:MAG: hypothetical protein H5T75_02020 [Coriobacteriia bacterium]|nr:hypothetical protein [Coriobacteriia bacterium]MDI6843453.1 hypothetical protein [Anaerosomatales bacterium]
MLGFVRVRPLAAALAALALLAAFGCSAGVTERAAPPRPATEERAETVVVPDFVHEVGESEFSMMNAEASDYAPRYGSPQYVAAYEAIARRSGLRVEFVRMSQEDEVFTHGMAGFPAGQRPEPGTRVKRGSVVRLVLIVDDAVR